MHLDAFLERQRCGSCGILVGEEFIEKAPLVHRWVLVEYTTDQRNGGADVLRRSHKFMGLCGSCSTEMKHRAIRVPSHGSATEEDRNAVPDGDEKARLATGADAVNP